MRGIQPIAGGNLAGVLVALRRAGLVLGWVTVYGHVVRLQGTFYCVVDDDLCSCKTEMCAAANSKLYTVAILINVSSTQKFVFKD